MSAPAEKSTFVSRYFCNVNSTPLVQIVFSLVWGILFAPFSWGLFFLIVFIIVYEWLYYVFTKGNPLYWQYDTRAGVVTATILGFIIGRTLAGQVVLVEGVPNLELLAETYIKPYIKPK